MAIQVKLWDQPLGYLNWNEKMNCSFFKYDEKFLESNIEISPIHLPLNRKYYYFSSLPFNTYKGLPGVFADSLPDKFGEGLMNSYFKNTAISFADLNPLDRLAYIGTRGMGALEYHPARAIKTKSNNISLDELESLARYGLNKAGKIDVHYDVDNSSKAFEEILSIGTSAGGARAKAIIAWNEDTGEMKSGQLEHEPGFEYWIIKLDVKNNASYLSDSVGYGRIEYTYYEIAQKCGIPMQPCKLMEDQGRGHFMTKRFDRQEGRKNHIHTLCGLRHINYENIAEHSYKHLFETARYLNVAYKDMEQLYSQMIFNVVGCNYDDHTKNFSFMLTPSLEWKVTPAYDLCYSYDPANAWVNSHMSINDKRNNITFQDLLKVGEENDIKQPQKIIENVLDGFSEFQAVAKKNNVKTEFIQQIQNSMNRVNKELGTFPVKKKANNRSI